MKKLCWGSAPPRCQKLHAYVTNIKTYNCANKKSLIMYLYPGYNNNQTIILKSRIKPSHRGSIFNTPRSHMGCPRFNY